MSAAPALSTHAPDASIAGGLTGGFSSLYGVGGLWSIQFAAKIRF